MTIHIEFTSETLGILKMKDIVRRRLEARWLRPWPIEW